MAKKYVVCLADAERRALEAYLANHTAPARHLMRAQVLLDADEGCARRAMTDQAICTSRSVSMATVQRVRRAYATGSLATGLNLAPARPCRGRKLTAEQAAELVALAASPPPEGHKCWSLRLLAEYMAARPHMPPLSYETVRSVLRRNGARLPNDSAARGK